MTGRISARQFAATLTAAVVAGVAGVPAAAAQSAPDLGRAFVPKPVSQPLYEIQEPSEDPELQRRFITAADGTKLFLEAWLPKAKDGHVPPKRIPSILTISPYLRLGAVGSAATRNTVVPHGYAYVQLHVRGTGESGGCIEDHSAAETDDGARAVEFLGRHAPWTDGNVGGFGLSYPGGSIFATAAEGDPEKVRYLKAMVVGAPVAARYETPFMDGVPQIIEPQAAAAVFVWLSRPGDRSGPADIAQRPGCYAGHEPWRDAFSSGDVTPYYQEREYRDSSPRVRAATLMWHGFQDLDATPNQQPGMFERLRAPKHGIFGVFGHELISDHSFSGVRPEWERPDWPDILVAWFDRWVKGLPSGAHRWPTAQVQGLDGQWRVEPEWPTTGGPVGQLGLGAGGELGATAPSGSTQYREAEVETAAGRTQLSAATFQTGPLADRLHLAGQPVLDAWVTLDRPDARLAAVLEAIHADGDLIPGGRVFGLRSVRHLDPLVDNRFAQAEGKPAPVGTPVRVPLRLNPMDLVIPRGGRLRLTLAGTANSGKGLSELIQYFGLRNAPVDPLGIGHPSTPSGSATAVTIHHDCEHESALRFLMPRPTSDLLNVREEDEPADQPLADNPPSAPLAVSGGGLAEAPICGRPPERLASFGPPDPRPKGSSSERKPALRMKVRPVRSRIGRRTVYRFLVTTRSEGVTRPVGAARIRLGAKRARTDRRGRARIVHVLGAPRRVRVAVATKPGYKSARASVRLVR